MIKEVDSEDNFSEHSISYFIIKLSYSHIDKFVSKVISHFAFPDMKCTK